MAAGDKAFWSDFYDRIPVMILKSAATTRVNNTLADDPDLVVPVSANSVYFIEFFLRVGAIPAEDFQTQWTVPSGAGGARSCIGPGSTALDASADNIAGRFGIHGFTTTVLYNGVRSANNLLFQVYEWCTVTVSTTAGNVALKWSQGTTGATGTIVSNGSLARATRIS